MKYYHFRKGLIFTGSLLTKIIESNYGVVGACCEEERNIIIIIHCRKRCERKIQYFVKFFRSLPIPRGDIVNRKIMILYYNVSLVVFEMEKYTPRIKLN